MSTLATFLTEKNDTESLKPIFFNLALDSDCQKIEKLFQEKNIHFVVDDFKEQQLELFGVLHPSKVYTPSFREEFEEYYKNLQNEKPLFAQGKWVYFPWSSRLVHILNEEDFFKVKTARNKNLINEEEQTRFYNACVAIGGLSVGSSIAFALALQGGAKRIKLADMDRLALSNTNRILMGVDNLGILKVEMAARRIYELNPYSEIELFTEGIHEDNIDRFLSGATVLIDELDNLAVKYLLREKAKKLRLPVVMAADNGDNAVIDIERYDLDENTPFFHGRMGGDISHESLFHLDKFGTGRMIAQHVGPENVTVRMQESLFEMGKTIVSWPQLGGAALVNGAAVAYCIRKIVNGQPLEINRALLSLDEVLVPDYFGKEEVRKREEAEATFRKIFSL